MNNYIDYMIRLSAQAAGNAAFKIPLDTSLQPLTFVSAICNLSAVAGSPSAVTIDVTLTDGTTTNVVVTASSIGTAAGQTRHTPDAGAVTSVPIGESDWHADIDFNFTAGSSPTVTGLLTLRFAY